MADTDTSDLLIFDDEGDEPDAPSTEGDQQTARLPGWKLLVVDDDPEIHTVTRMVLSNMSFRGAPVHIISAYSGKEAGTILREDTGIAVILLDVVMETDDAGLRLVREIRNDMQNTNVRIILRTGQPGQAPEREVIVEYDINDYKAKTELTAQKLFTAVISGLRAYEHIVAIDESRRGLERIVSASSTLQRRRSLELFASGVLMQMNSLLGLEADGILCAHQALEASPEHTVAILAGCGRFEEMVSQPVEGNVEPDVMTAIISTLETGQNQFGADHFTLHLRTPNNKRAIVYVSGHERMSDLDRQLIEVFCSNISVGFDNVYLFDQLRKAHEATVVALADLAEFKDNDTGSHVLRVARSTDVITRRLMARGTHNDIIDEFFLELVGMASILHDVGKIGVPDAILQKPGRLDDNELPVMQRHAEMGGQILQKAAGMVDGVTYLSLGAEIAQNHHEKFDGSGYPAGIKGSDIPLSARIVAVADVYDALVHKRPYKEPWPKDKAIGLIRDNSGSHFDPEIVDVFLEAMEAGEIR